MLAEDEDVQVAPMLGEIIPGEDAENPEQAPDKENAENENEENVDDGAEDEDSDDDGIVVTIGDIVTNVPQPKRFQVQKLDPNVIPTVNGKSIFDANPTELDEKPWLKPGANIADYFNFGFTEETWNEYAEKQRLLRLEYPTQAEINKTIMDELKVKHGNREVHVPVVMPVYNTGGRNLVTIGNMDNKPTVKIGFDHPHLSAQPLIMKTILTQPAPNTPPLNGPSSFGNQMGHQDHVQAPIEKIVVDLTDLGRSRTNFNQPPSSMSQSSDLEKQDGPPGAMSNVPTGPPGAGGFNFNTPPPNFNRVPTTNLTFPRPNMYNRPPMGGYYNPPMNAGPGMMHGGMGGNRMPLIRPSGGMADDAPPGIGGSSRASMDAPPGLDNFGYGGGDRYDRGRDRLEEKYDRGNRDDRRRESEEPDDRRRRRERERDEPRRDDRGTRDRGRERERDRDKERSRDKDRESSRKRRDSAERHESSRPRDDKRDDRKRKSRERDPERDRKRHKDDRDDRDSRRRRERSPRIKLEKVEGEEGPPGV